MATKKKRVATIQVPTAPARPGDKPKFAAWTNQPGDLSRPDPLTCTAADTTDHALGLVRVLDDEGKARGPWTPDLRPDELRTGLEHIVRTSIF